MNANQVDLTAYIDTPSYTQLHVSVSVSLPECGQSVCAMAIT